MLLSILAGCPLPPNKSSLSAENEPPDIVTEDSAEPEDTDTGCVPEPGPPADKFTGGEPRVATVMVADITWALAFDRDAEVDGYDDCTYRSVYEANVEVSDQGYLCPGCGLITLGSGVTVDGYDDCYLQIGSTEAERLEYLGLGEVDGATHFFRSGKENVSLRDMGATDGASAAWSDEGTLDGGGALVLSAVATFTSEPSATETVADPTGARTEPYACGWPLNNPGGTNAAWPLALGEMVPNVRLDDQCGEPVDLWDFRGYYLVLDASSPNCGPCQSMASEAEAFKARMEEACVAVELVTLLNASLSAVNMPADLETRVEWATAFGLSSPVLADRGFAYALIPTFLGRESGMSLPSTIVVDPEGRLIYGASGFAGWDEFEAVILADVAARAE